MVGAVLEAVAATASEAFEGQEIADVARGEGAVFSKTKKVYVI